MNLDTTQAEGDPIPTKTPTKTTKAPAKPAKKPASASASKTTAKKPTVAKKPAVKKPAATKSPVKKTAAKKAVPASVKKAAAAAGPKKPTPKKSVKTVAKPEPKKPSLEQLIAGILDERKAEDIITIDLANKADFADSMVIASGTSARHVAALAAHVIDELKAMKVKTMVEGLDSCDWVLVDAGDVIVHLFKPEAREYYKLEKMWSVPAQA